MYNEQHKRDEHHIRELIRNLPQREAPNGFVESVMQRIQPVQPSLGQRIAQFLTGSVMIELRPLRMAGALASLALVFWFGLTVGERQHSALQSAPDQLHLLSEVSRTGEANYFIGRSFVAEGRWEEAALFFQKASALDPENPEYNFMKGIAVGKLGNKEGEQNIYRATIDLHPAYVPARLFLGHSLLEDGQYEDALSEYDQVLAYSPQAETALYNRALAYQFLGDEKLEASAWKDYLFQYREGRWSYRAVEHLNALGDFTYRGYQIGFRQVIVNQDLLLGPDTPSRQREIDILADSFGRASGRELNIIVFQADSAAQAAKKAKGLKSSIISRLGDTEHKSVKISWFGQAETGLKVSGKQISLAESLLVFSNPNVNDRRGEGYESSI